MLRITILLSILQGLLFASLEDDIIKICPKEYRKHVDIVSDYIVRMEDDIKNEGCSVIPLYSAIIQAENFDILDEIEENPKILQHLKKLSSINSNLSTLLFKSKTIKKIVLTNSLNENFLENFTYLTEKKLQKSEIRKIERNNNYLNYFLLASRYGENKRESLKLYSKIKSSVSIELMPSLSLI
jgi:hypothetical protein